MTARSLYPFQHPHSRNNFFPGVKNLGSMQLIGKGQIWNTFACVYHSLPNRSVLWFCTCLHSHWQANKLANKPTNLCTLQSTPLPSGTMRNSLSKVKLDSLTMHSHNYKVHLSHNCILLSEIKILTVLLPYISYPYFQINWPYIRDAMLTSGTLH